MPGYGALRRPVSPTNLLTSPCLPTAQERYEQLYLLRMPPYVGLDFQTPHDVPARTHSPPPPIPMLMGLLASTPAWIFACLVLPCWGHTWAYNLRCSCPTSTLRLGGAGGLASRVVGCGTQGWLAAWLAGSFGWLAGCLSSPSHLAISFNGKPLSCEHTCLAAG